MTEPARSETTNVKRPPRCSHEEALAVLGDVQLEIETHARRLRHTGLPLDPYLEQLERLARRLADEYHAFHDRKRFSVGIHHGVVHAEDREEAVRTVFEGVGPEEEIEITVDGEPVSVDEVLAGEQADDAPR